MIFTPICVRAYNKHNEEYFCFSYTAISTNVFEIRWISTVTRHLENIKAFLSLNLIQTGCLSAYSVSFTNVFKTRCFDLVLLLYRWFLQRDNIGSLEIAQLFAKTKKMVVLKRTGVLFCVV